MNQICRWVAVLSLIFASACSAEESATANTEQAAPENTAVVSQANNSAADQKPVRVAQATPTTANFRSGRDYQLLTPVQPTSSAPEEIEVAEAFMYGCPHCFSFEPFMQNWAPNKPENVKVIRIPVAFNRQAQVHARVYYTAEALGVIEQTHMPFFREIHVNRRPMTSETELVNFFEDFGVDEETFKKTFRSFEVETKLRMANTLAQRYRISSVPTVIVNGKYTTNGSNLSGDKLVSLIDHLVSKEKSRE